MNYILFGAVTFIVIIIVENITYKIVGYIFRSHLIEIEKKEREIAEYQELMILALAAKDKDAYKGLNEIADDLYWKIFFRKLIIFSTSFFLLFSPYIFFSRMILGNTIKGIVGFCFVIAICYFMFKTIFQYIINIVAMRREYLKNKQR